MYLRRRVATILALAVAVITCALFSPSVAQAENSEENQNMYRMYNCISHEHLYTADMNERETLRTGDWIYEGVGWVAPTSSNTSVYRLYNPILGDHHYTTDQHEVSVLTSQHGWRNEGVKWYSDDEKRVQVYRQFNSRLTVGSHNYTTDSNEYNVNNARNGWNGEGIAWYAITTGWQEAEGLVPNACEARLAARKAAQAAQQQNTAVTQEVYYRSCAQFHEIHGNNAMLRRGEPGYRPGLDRDDDGKACEPYHGR